MLHTLHKQTALIDKITLYTVNVVPTVPTWYLVTIEDW